MPHALLLVISQVLLSTEENVHGKQADLFLSAEPKYVSVMPACQLLREQLLFLLFFASHGVSQY